MRNRIEASLSNHIFGDVTAWRAIRNAEKTNLCNSSFEEKKRLGQSEKVKIGNPQNERITGLSQQLGELRRQKKQGLITPSAYRICQKELASQLHEQMRKAGHKPIRTMVKKTLTSK